LSNPDPHALEEIDRRLRDGDPTAPSDLAELVLDPLARSLRARFPDLEDPSLVDDAVADTVLNYAERPDQFDPSKRGLFGYLAMSARGDLMNALAAVRRRRGREASLDVVELPLERRNKASMEREPSATFEDQVISDLASQRMMARVREAVETPEDAKVLQLMIDGERGTDRFAQVLGLEGLTADERRREVKRHKDRLKKRLERLGLAPDV
jgi:RNA polymerase sigma-70 factor, ECF subfamily